MAEKNQARPKNADCRQDQQPIATKPMHARIIPARRDYETSGLLHCHANFSLIILSAARPNINFLLDPEISKPHKNPEL